MSKLGVFLSLVLLAILVTALIVPEVPWWSGAVFVTSVVLIDGLAKK